MSTNLDDTIQYIYKEVVQQYVPSYVLDIGYTPWVFSLLGSALIGLSGILPLFIIPNIGDGKAQAFNRKCCDWVGVLIIKFYYHYNYY